MNKKLYLSAVSAIGLLAFSPVGYAQSSDETPANVAADEASDNASAEDLRMSTVLTTARKRSESLQDVPVTVSAFTGEQIQDLRIDSIDNLTALIPGFYAVDTVDTAPQGTIALRGVTTGATAIGADQAISINVDGVQIESALGMRAGQIDLQQIEVLKGPQALFFGKNATGGVIAIKTADPTDELYVKASVGHEFNAEETFGEFVVSGPLSETLGARAVVYYTSVDGWVDNIATGFVDDRTGPDYEELIGRVTLKWDPSDDFDARFKVSYADRDSNNSTIAEKFVCPDPTREPSSDCTLDFAQSNVDVSQTFPGRQQYDDTSATIASLDMNYNVSDNLTISSITGYYDIDEKSDGHPWPVDTQQASIVEITQTVKSISQELRLTSDFDGPFNFMIGGFFDDREQTHTNRDFFFGTLPVPQTFQTLESESFSLFAQGIWDISDQWELSGGLRYSDETKKYDGQFIADYFAPVPPPTGPITQIIAAGQPINTQETEISFDNVSPEVTLSYKPNNDVTLFATYKEGYKSGSFDIGTGNAFTGFAPPGAPATSNDFRPEEASGGEIGFKTEFADGDIRLNGALYSYEYTDLQLASINNNTGTIGTTNASSSQIEGIEADLLWAPSSIDGLTLMAAVNYNSAKYSEQFLTRCNSVQLTGMAPGCDFDLSMAPQDPGNDFQDLNGEDLVRAPEWAGTAGFVLDKPDSLGSGGVGYRLGLNLVYSGSYQGNTVNDPRGIHDSYVLLNGNFGLYDSDGWELELVGRNLTNEAVSVSSPEQPLASPPGQLTDLLGTPGRAREVVLQITKTW